MCPPATGGDKPLPYKTAGIIFGNKKEGKMFNDESQKVIEMFLAAITVVGIVTAIFHWMPR